MTAIVGPQDLTNRNLAPETCARLSTFVALLEKWNPSINLVSRNSLSAVWTRHIHDSLQILPLWKQDAGPSLDIGSGAGLPGMVLAIALAETAPDHHMTLVEADKRKAEFLRTVSRETGVDVNVIALRIEDLPLQNAGTLTARALAPLPQLCSYAQRHLAAHGRAIFLKGAQVDAEIAEARKHWSFQIERHASQTDPTASILILSDLHHV